MLLYTQRQSKLQNNLIYKKIDTLQKSRQFASRYIYKKPDTLRYAICHEMFEVGICVQKLWHFALHDVFIKKPDTSQKSRQFSLRFYMQKLGHFALHDFHETFEIGGGERGISIWKNNAICVTFL